MATPMSEPNAKDHQAFVKTPKQLITVVVLAFAVPITLIWIVVQFVMGDFGASKERPGMSDEAIAKRIRPVAEETLAVAPPRQADRSGKEVVEAVCSKCHASGANGAPKIGDRNAWAKLAAESLSRLTDVALKGIRQMPPHGGNPDLSDTEITRGIAYMVNQSGGNWIEPVSKTVAVADRSGEQIVQAQCSKCHQTGVGGAPKMGDRDAWTARATRGLEPVFRSAIKGHGGMPARGGMAELTDAEVRNAVMYMFNFGRANAAGTQAAAAPVAGAGAAKAEVSKGKSVYDAACAVCHAAGVAGAPKPGDKSAWAPRLKSGVNALYGAALKGKGAMPPKGGNASLTDADVKAAVDYLASTAK
jgi:cytochrome c5